MALLCISCGRNELTFTISTTPNYIYPGARPEIVAIECKPKGTGNLSRCRFVPGSPEFFLISEWYWIVQENKNAILDLLDRQNEFMQTLMYRVYEQVASRQALEVSMEERKRLEREKQIPGQLKPYEPPKSAGSDVKTDPPKQE